MKIAIPGWGENQTPPAHRNYAPMVVCSVMLFCAWVTICMRLYTRLFLVFAFGWDDVFMMLSLACFTIYGGGMIDVIAKDSLLDHMAYPDLQSAVKGIMLVLVFYVVTITFLKISLGIFLVRIINQKSHRILVYVVMAVSTAWGIAVSLVAVFQCGYPKDADFYIQQRLWGRCIPGDMAVGFTYSHAVVSASSDVIFTTLPLFILRDAQINKRAKIVLGVILMMGAVGSVASLVRFVYIEELKVVTNQFFLQAGNLSIWSSLECGLGISAGSLATLRPMFRKMLQGAKTIGNRTKETLTGSSGRHGTTRMTESRHKSFARRFSLSSKRATMSTARRLSDAGDLEAFPSPALPGGKGGASEKPYEMTVSVHALPKAKTKTQSPRDKPSYEWSRSDPYSPEEPVIGSAQHQYEPSRAYTPRRNSHDSSRYSRSEQSHEQTWI